MVNQDDKDSSKTETPPPEENFDPSKDFLSVSTETEFTRMNRRYSLGVRTKNSPQSYIVIVYDAGLDESGFFHSAEWHDGDWSSDGIQEACLWFFIWVESLRGHTWKLHNFFFFREKRGFPVSMVPF
ncbi:hypothetical protein TNCV_543001 [Trichonephila clavipes]|nr:hypothetical protein TNCV_543001 [Trichonephila clavipes]